MRKVQSIHFMKPVPRVRYFDTGYKYMKPKKHKWLARLCWWVLNKLDALSPYFETVERWTLTESKHKELIKQIMEARETINRYAFDRQEFVIIMGDDTFRELVQYPYMTTYNHFVVEGGRFEHSVLDMRVIVAPFHQGFVIVPTNILGVNNDNRISQS